MERSRELKKAKDYAYKLLSYRQRSSKEIAGRLKKKGFSLRTVQETIKYLSQLNYLNDESFAKSWIQAKADSNPVGWSLLQYQLRRKGVAAEILERVFTECAGTYNEYDAAKRLVHSRRQRYKRLSPLKVKKKLYDYLRRRGFCQEAILQAIGLEDEG